MSDSRAQNEERLPVKFIPLRENEIPTDFTLKTEVSSFWHRLIPSKKDRPADKPTPSEYRRLGNQAQGKMVPELKPEIYFEAMDRLHSRFRERGSVSQLLFIICEPFSPIEQVIGQWAENNGRVIVSPPDPISSDDASPRETLPEAPWLIPGLEKWFARHAFGLDRVRKLIRRLRDRENADGVILCGGWAWNYLESVAGLKPFSDNLYTLRSIDSDRFADIVMDLSEEVSGRPVEFRNAENGESVLRRNPDPENPEATVVTYDDFLDHLVSHARGNLAIASSLWAKSIRTEPEEVSDNSAELTDQKQEDKQIYWTVPWSRMELPEVPSDIEWNHTVLLHSLLIHNGLSLDLMREILPHTGDELTKSLSELEEQELVERSGDDYRVSEAGYPAVRKHLHRSGYLTDPF